MKHTQKQMEDKWKKLDNVEKAKYDGFRGFVIRSSLIQTQN
jgi:hypothetical protein